MGRNRARCTAGFTLIELLVVIAIIAILVGILFPVFSRAREKARQAKCSAQLHEIQVALKSYYEDYQAYPPPPTFNPSLGTMGRFTGGVSALYPDYISDLTLLICPDDEMALMKMKDAKAMVYSSYNADFDFRAFDASTSKVATYCDTGTDANGNPVTYLKNRLYNYFGYMDNYPSGSAYPYGYDPYQFAGTAIYVGPENGSTLPWWLSEGGLSWRFYPRLMNKYAPDNTIVLHCVKHRRFYKTKDEKDIVLRLGGDVSTEDLSSMAGVITPSGGGTGVTEWVAQR